jgi:hypothetical protein
MKDLKSRNLSEFQIYAAVMCQLTSPKKGVCTLVVLDLSYGSRPLVLKLYKKIFKVG